MTEKSMVDTLLILCAVTTPEGPKWTGIEGLAVHKGSIYALDSRGLVMWNGYRQRAKVTRFGWDVAGSL